ncbi:fecR family protein [Bordetella holmesii 35009]|nr:fecR family protein [Bordetella holmesii 35009]
MQQGVRQVPAPLAHAAFKPQSSGRRTMLRGVVAAAVAGATGWGVYHHTPWQRLIADRSTGLGEVRKIAIAPGLYVTLSSDTAIQISRNADRHLLRLLRGQVQVQASAAAVQLDTGVGLARTDRARFCVRRGAHGCELQLLDGGLVLEREMNRTRLSAPQGMWLPDSGVWHQRPPNPDAGAWVDGLIVAHDWPLHMLVARLADHRRGVIHLDPELADTRVSGVFPLFDAERALKAVAHSVPIAVQRRGPFWLSVGQA